MRQTSQESLLNQRDRLIAEYRRLLVNAFERPPACFADPQMATRVSEARLELTGDSFNRQLDQFSEYVLAPAAERTAEELGECRLGPTSMFCCNGADGNYTLHIVTLYTLARDCQ